MFSTCPSSIRPSVCLFICYRSCEHNILKTNGPVLLQIGARASPKRSAFGISRSRSHDAEVRFGGVSNFLYMLHANRGCVLLFQCFHRLAHALLLHFVSVRSLEADVFPCNVHM